MTNKKGLLDKLYASVILSKFNLKTGCWHIQIHKTDKYKTIFNVPFEQFELDVFPFGITSTSYEFQELIDNIFAFTKIPELHFKHLKMLDKTLMVQ